LRRAVDALCDAPFATALFATALFATALFYDRDFSTFVVEASRETV
jgi:hypothetical protein